MGSRGGAASQRAATSSACASLVQIQSPPTLPPRRRATFPTAIIFHGGDPSPGGHGLGWFYEAEFPWPWLGWRVSSPGVPSLKPDQRRAVAAVILDAVAGRPSMEGATAVNSHRAETWQVKAATTLTPTDPISSDLGLRPIGFRLSDDDGNNFRGFGERI
jgi:hypothetical protein